MAPSILDFDAKCFICSNASTYDRSTLYYRNSWMCRCGGQPAGEPKRTLTMPPTSKPVCQIWHWQRFVCCVWFHSIKIESFFPVQQIQMLVVVMTYPSRHVSRSYCIGRRAIVSVFTQRAQSQILIFKSSLLYPILIFSPVSLKGKKQAFRSLVGIPARPTKNLPPLKFDLL